MRKKPVINELRDHSDEFLEYCLRLTKEMSGMAFDPSSLDNQKRYDAGLDAVMRALLIMDPSRSESYRKSYIRAAIRNVGIELQKKRSRREPSDHMVKRITIGKGYPDPEENLSAKEILSVIVSGLKDEIDKKLLMAKIQGYENKEIEAKMGQNPGWAKVRNHRLRKKVANLLEDIDSKAA